MHLREQNNSYTCMKLETKCFFLNDNSQTRLIHNTHSVLRIFTSSHFRVSISRHTAGAGKLYVNYSDSKYWFVNWSSTCEPSVRVCVQIRVWTPVRLQCLRVPAEQRAHRHTQKTLRLLNAPLRRAYTEYVYNCLEQFACELAFRFSRSMWIGCSGVVVLFDDRCGHIKTGDVRLQWTRALFQCDESHIRCSIFGSVRCGASFRDVTLRKTMS